MSGDSALLGRRLILLTCASLFTGSGGEHAPESQLVIHAQLPSLFVSDGVPRIHVSRLRLMCRALIQSNLGTRTWEAKEGQERSGVGRGDAGLQCRSTLQGALGLEGPGPSELSQAGPTQPGLYVSTLIGQAQATLGRGVACPGTPVGCFGKGRGPWPLTPGPGSPVKRPQLKAVLQQPPPRVWVSCSFPTIPSPSPSQPPPSTPSPVSGAASPGPSGHCAVPLRWHGCPWMRHIPAYLPSAPPCDNALPGDHAPGLHIWPAAALVPTSSPRCPGGTPSF